jgi:hypothetical protein
MAHNELSFLTTTSRPCLATNHDLTAGKNCMSQLSSTSYLVRFTNLQLLNMAGNPLCQDPDYKSYVLSHLKHLLYLDYRYNI